MSQKKMGRPPIDNPMNERITVRLDKKSSQILNKYCEQTKVDRAQAIRIGISKLEEK